MIPFTYVSRKCKLVNSNRKHINGALRVGEVEGERGITEGHEGHFGSDGYICYLNCGDSIINKYLSLFSIVIKLYILDTAIHSTSIIHLKSCREYYQVPNAHKFLRRWCLPLCIHCLMAFRSFKFY